MFTLLSLRGVKGAHIAVVAIECAERTLQILLLLHSGFPRKPESVFLLRGRSDDEVLIGKFSRPLLVAEFKHRSRDFNPRALLHFVIHRLIIAVHRHKRLVVGELSVGRIFQSDCPL